MSRNILTVIAVSAALFLGGCCPQYDCVSPYLALTMKMKTDGDSASFDPVELDSILVVQKRPNTARADTQIWRYTQGVYEQYYPVSGGSGTYLMYLETPSYDTMYISPVRGYVLKIQDYKTKSRVRTNEFGCQGCPETLSASLSINGIRYELMHNYSNTSAPVDISGGTIVVKGVK